MKHKIKILVVAILCAFMVGCAQSEQPVQQDAQTSQTQQSEVKEDTQTAEQTQKETPEEVLQRCTLKGEWSPELTKLMETINAEHQAIQKPVFSEEKYAKYFKKRENNTISEKAEPNLDGSLSLAQIESDVNFLFDSLRQNYGLYEYFGGEEVFEPARSRVLEQCKENKQMDASKLETLLIQELSFINDSHFIIGNCTMVIMHAPFFYIEEEYHKEGSQYKTNDGKIVESIEGYENLDEVMKHSLNRQGEIVYYPVKLVEADYPKIYLTGKKLDPARCLYQDGQPVHLAKKEFDIVELLSMHPSQVFGRERIYESVWGWDSEGDSSVVAEHIRRIRAKLTAAGCGDRIATIWGVGYKWQ